MEAVRDVARAVYRAESIEREPQPAILEVYRSVAALAASARASGAANRMVVLALCGSQGSGKSTTARVVQDILVKLHGLNAATLSLDDLYLSGEARRALAASVHPLLATRGVPGTHDVALGRAIIDRLASATDDAEVPLPRFDKARDEPSPVAEGVLVRGRPDVLLFEGWCVGAVAQPPADLLKPVNDLERREDPDGRWRRYVNDCLAGDYRRLFARIQRLVLLRAPRFERIVDWRCEQEHKLRARLTGATAPVTDLKVMSDSQVARFVMHYERITRHILAEMPARADLTIELGEDREVRSVAARRAHS